MNYLFIGLGSIAKRHIKNVKELKPASEITVLRSGKGLQLEGEWHTLIDYVCYSEVELQDSYDAIFITNPTSAHYGTLEKYQNISNCFFVEKPVFVTGKEDITAFDKVDKKYYVACPLRYTNVIQWMKENIDFATVNSMRVISSSYLPDWRPGTDYRNTYSAHRDLGGGVSIDLIHEWDYISYLVGFPQRVNSIITKKSKLDIDTDDIAVYIAEYEDKVVEVHLDYFGRKPLRCIELFTEEETIRADLIDQKIEWMSSGEVLSLSEDRNSYQKKELMHFFDIMNGILDSDNNIEEACRVLRIARGDE